MCPFKRTWTWKECKRGKDNKITKTIISTNLSLQEMYNNYEERIVSRIIGNYNACYFYGEDIRMKKRLATK